MLIRYIALSFLLFSAGVQASDIAYPKNEKNPRIEIKTNQGSITIEVFADKAPQSANYFLANVLSGYYSNTTFHRVSKDFIIQGGAYTAELNKKADKPNLTLERTTALKNRRGTLAVARKLSDANSGNTEFFINLVENPQLDYQSDKSPANQGFVVFAQVIDGMNVVDKIRKVQTTQKTGLGAAPNNPIIIQSMTRIAN
jgi:cyclophilin family peptidyl-prolyl cis-trans isomerase